MTLTDTDNSLFAKGSNYTDSESDEKTYTDASGGIKKVPAHTALIANLRHLQNLSLNETAGFTSKVGGGIMHAQQLRDIDCEKAKRNNGSNITPDDKSYEFIPIVNGNLTSYDGRNGVKNTHIYNLSTKEGLINAGLFGTVDPGKELSIENCRVCWKDSDTPDKLVLGTEINYRVSGTSAGGNAGGLVGSVANNGKVTIKNSFAATTVEGESNAGGLVGSVGSGSTVTITNSYADCYLNATTNAGGLVGSNSGTVKLTNCYAAGFITGGTNTAGLVGGTAAPTADHVYSVVRVLKTKTEGGTTTTTLAKPGAPLYGSMGEPTTGSVRYLCKKEDAKTVDVKTALGIGSGSFVAAPGTTHVYNLRHKLSNESKDKVGSTPQPLTA